MKLYNGDCLEIMKSIKDKSIDAIITDPPYGTTACKWDSVIPFNLMWKQLNRIIKDNGAIVLFGSEPFSSALRMSNIKNYRYDWIYEKPQGTGFLNAKKRPLVSYETISVFYKKQSTYNPQMTQGKPYCFNHNTESSSGKTYGKYKTTKRQSKGNRYPKSVLRFNNKNPNSQGLHPTQKPVALMEYLIKTYTNEFETVLDFTMGSGSTGVACCNTNRDFIGIELDKEYFEIAEQRIKNEL
jgi:DNA modification methylase